MGRRQQTTSLSDFMPVENLDALTLEQGSVASEKPAVNSQSAINKQSAGETTPAGHRNDVREQMKSLVRTPRETSTGQKHAASMTHSSVGRGRTTRDRSSRGRDSRNVAVAVASARGKAKARSAGGRKSEATQRPVRSDAQQAVVNQPVGTTIARTIYTSDGRPRSVGDPTAERSSTVAVVPGLTCFITFNSTSLRPRVG